MWKHIGTLVLIAVGIVTAVNIVVGLPMWLLSGDIIPYFFGTIWSNIIAVKIFIMPLVYFYTIYFIKLPAEFYGSLEQKYNHTLILALLVYEMDLMVLFIVMNNTIGFNDLAVFIFSPASLVLWWVARMNVAVAGINKTS